MEEFWTSRLKQLQEEPPTAPQAPMYHRATKSREPLRKNGDTQAQGNHPEDMRAHSENNQGLNEGISSSITPIPTQVSPVPRLLSRSRPHRPSFPSGDDISDFIASMSTGEDSFDKQRAKHQQVSCHPATTGYPQDSVSGSSHEWASNYSTELSQTSPLSLSPAKEHLSVSEQESVRLSNLASPCSIVVKQQPRDSPDEGVSTSSPEQRRSSTNGHEQHSIKRSNKATHPSYFPLVPKRETQLLTRPSSDPGVVAESPEPLEVHNVPGHPSRTRSQDQQEKEHDPNNVDIISNEPVFQNQEFSSPSTQLPSPDNQGTSAAPNPCVSQDKDLRDWLEFTGFNNNQYRARYLARQRRMVALDKLRAEIEQEDQRDRPGVMTPSRPFTETGNTPLPSKMTQIAVNTDFGDNMSVPQVVLKTPTLSAETPNTCVVGTIKRSRDDEEIANMPTAKFPRTKYSEKVEQIRSKKNEENMDEVEEPHSGLPERPPSSRLPPGCPDPPNPSSHEHERSTSPPLRRPISSKSSNWRHSLAHIHGVSAEKTLSNIDSEKLDLGQPSDSRFFAIKSYSDHNVRTCMEDGVWVTQTLNSEIFASAFRKCKNVILIFSVNKSKAFQGYARMTSAPSPYTPEPRWLKRLNFDISAPFYVEWFCKTEMPFSIVHHLCNSLNEDSSVIVGKDGQEIEEGCARELIKEMDKLEEEKIEFEEHMGKYGKAYNSWGWGEKASRLPRPFPSSGRGTYRGGRGGGGSLRSRGNPRGQGRGHIKNEWL